MKNRLSKLLNVGKKTKGDQNYPESEQSCAGRILSATTFIVIIICLGLWISTFLILKDRVFTETLAGNLLTNLTCLTFFGGLVISIFVGAMAGNSIRRSIWKWLTRRRKT